MNKKTQDTIGNLKVKRPNKQKTITEIDSIDFKPKNTEEKPIKVEKPVKVEKPKEMVLEFEYRMIFGRKIFFANNPLAKLLTQIGRKQSFTIDEIKQLQSHGFIISLVSIDPYELLK